MKSSIALLVVAALLGSSAAVSLHKKAHAHKVNKKAAQDVFAQVQSVMASSQQALAKAERHHKKIVKQMRKQLETAIDTNAESIGDELGAFAGELEEARVVFARAVNASKAALAKSQAEPQKIGVWGTPEDSARARLSAKIGEAEQVIRRTEHKNKLAIHQATDKAEDAIEDEAGKLSRKLGDVTPIVEKAKTSVEAKAVVSVNVTGIERQLQALEANATGAGMALLKAAEKHLDDATSEEKKVMDNTNKKINAVLEKSGKNLTAKVNGIVADVKKSEVAEMQKIKR